MSKAVVWWSQTGNTEAMANILADAASAEAIEWSDFSADSVGDYESLAFGCPAMGDEELDSDFEELWGECKGALGDRPVVLFGSFDWGTGEWMDTWKEDAEAAGVNVVATVIANLEPDDEAEAALRDAAAKM